MQLWLENYQLLHAARPIGWEGPGVFTIADMNTMFERYRWEEMGIEFDYYARTLLALDEVTREYHKRRQPPSRDNG